MPANGHTFLRIGKRGPEHPSHGFPLANGQTDGFPVMAAVDAAQAAGSDSSREDPCGVTLDADVAIGSGKTSFAWRVLGNVFAGKTLPTLACVSGLKKGEAAVTGSPNTSPSWHSTMPWRRETPWRSCRDGPKWGRGNAKGLGNPSG